MEHEEGFGPWLDESEGEGIYHFIGWREHPNSGSGVTTNDLVEVARYHVSRDKEVLIVRFFGRSQSFRHKDFQGKWRKLSVEFTKGRSK